MGRHEAGARNRLPIDEVQLCGGFEKAINSIHARGGWDVCLTGSNAFPLSSDLATLFTGRHREVHILPFGFGEYRSYFGGQGAVDDDFDGFVRRAGSPGPATTMTSRSRTATSATSTGPSSRATSSRGSRCPAPPCWRGWPST